MEKKIQQIKTEILAKLSEVKDGQFLRDLEVKYMGRKGVFTEILRSLSELSAEEKTKIGKLANEIKLDIQVKFAEAKKVVEGERRESFLDVTLPGKKIEAGHIHPISQIQEELEDLFISMGFMVLDGPELESDYFNFEALNVPEHHPGRDMQDTFYVGLNNDEKFVGGDNKLLMRTHTSPVQVRAMLKYGAPIKVVVPGRCFRNEATDARHEHTFYQFEGLMIDKNINFSHMKGILEKIGKNLFNEQTELRMRPKFYPFVEPGSNGEYTCFLCQGRGCKVCKHSGWLEVMGCGLVHPNVLRAGGIDPEVYSGFAFGFGLTRLAMLKYGITDARLFNNGDMRFLEQF